MKPRPKSRPLTDLPMAALRRALTATIQAAGTDSSSAEALRRAIAIKQLKRKQGVEK